MKQILSFFIFISLFAMSITANSETVSDEKKQTKANVTGFVKDSESGEALVRATIQLMTPDTARMVTGITTNNLGGFTIKGVNEGNYIIKISYLGYHKFFRAVTIRNKETIHNVGTIIMTPTSIMLKEAVVTAALQQAVVKEDTIIFNADAFKVEEGSVLEDLVKKLPGAQVDSDGKITING
ncbi:MAG: carboxypeptidase-like regulatory domain-containing protein, partial [Bacteroidaceae bacterium]|nr:carboxypeptidase-like regulatory domain-containing protein [Bacteroidaceae bacterium]